MENNQQVEFTFINNTVIEEINNPNNYGTLNTLQSTVVWWDDAEGEMQPYYLKQSVVGYYSSNSATNFYYPPKNGIKSIWVGGTNTALLQIKINLTKNARLSFWYANKVNVLSATGTFFSINGVEKAKWTTNVDWSFMIINLEPGENDIIWEKKDGNLNNNAYYLSLDDILIYYTE